MRAGRKFSRFILYSLILLQGLSLTLVLGILYGILGRTMGREFYNRLQRKQVEVCMVLMDRFNGLESRLRELALDNTLRVSMMLGVESQALEVLARHYPRSSGAWFLVHDRAKDRYLPEIDPELRFLVPHLKRLSQSARVKVEMFRDFGKGKLLTLISFPIMRSDERLGTSYAIYDLARDERFWSRISGNLGGRLVFQGHGYRVNLRTGEREPVGRKDFQDECVFLPLKDFPGIYYAASTRPLREEKFFLVTTLAQLCGAVFLFTVVVSLFITRRMGARLENLAEQSLEIAENPSRRSLEEDKLGYLEFQKLAKAFNAVLARLLDAQEQLRARARKELDVSEMRYRRTLEAAPDAITISTMKDGRFIEVNDAFCQLTGYSREEALGKTAYDLNLYVDPKERDRLLKILEERGGVSGLELTFRKKDGTEFSVLLSARTMRLKGEECMVAVSSDITERKLADEALRESHHTLLTVLDSIEAGIYVADMETFKILFMNRYMKEIFGHGLEGEICYQALRNEKKPCQQCVSSRLVDRNGNPAGVVVWEGENPLTKKWYVNYARAIRWIDGRLVRYHVSFDITQLKELEKERLNAEIQLRKIQKMEAVGTLAGGVAHDLNNILTGIVSYPDLLLMQLPDDSPLRGPILTIQNTGKKAAAIVQDLLTLARRGVPVNEVVNLNDIVSEYLNSPEHRKIMAYHEGVRVETRLDPGLLNIMGSSVHLSKTVMNLVSNAAEAMTERGTIRITTRNQYLDQPVRGYEDVKEGDYVVLSVADTGIGISPEDQERIFEPFYTKKVMGRSGTGLGMAVVWGTVKDHEGYIDVESAVGKGTTFTLYFPVTRKEMARKPEAVSVDSYKGKGERILVVDDVREQREIASLLLSKLGYSVTTAASGEEAVEYLKENSADLLVLDMIMSPGMDGLDTYKKILEIHPGQRAIIASGYSENERVKEAQRLGAGPYVKKPYTLENIGLAVRRELDREARDRSQG